MSRYKYERVPVIGPVQSWLRERRAERAARRWRREGSQGTPPHLIKRQAVLKYAERFDCELLVETGTFMGDMVEAMRPHFERVYTVELSDELYRLAVARFRDCENVELIHGDSGKELPKLLPKLQGRTLFWLDGHFSAGATAKGEKETPISEELDSLLPRLATGDVLLIDDARLFGVDPDYPSLDTVRSWIVARAPQATMTIEDDIIRVVDQSSLSAAA